MWLSCEALLQMVIPLGALYPMVNPLVVLHQNVMPVFLVYLMCLYQIVSLQFLYMFFVLKVLRFGIT